MNYEREKKFGTTVSHLSRSLSSRTAVELRPPETPDGACLEGRSAKHRPIGFQSDRMDLAQVPHQSRSGHIDAVRIEPFLQVHFRLIIPSLFPISQRLGIHLQDPVPMGQPVRPVLESGQGLFRIDPRRVSRGASASAQDKRNREKDLLHQRRGLVLAKTRGELILKKIP